MLKNKTVLVTGGTGSFGKSCIRRILQDDQINKVIVFSRDELKQFEMQSIFKSPKLRYFLGDVRDFQRLKQATDGVDVIIHAAAIKQIPAAEYNPIIGMLDLVAVVKGLLEEPKLVVDAVAATHDRLLIVGRNPRDAKPRSDVVRVVTDGTRQRIGGFRVEGREEQQLVADAGVHGQA